MSQPYVTPADYPPAPGQDDTDSLNQTFNAAAALNATAWLMGAYTISGPLAIPAGVRVLGQGPAVTTITAAAGFGGGTPNVMMVADSGVTIDGITLDATPGGANVTQGLSMTTVSGVRVRQCVVMGASNSASAGQIFIEGCTDVVVSDCEVSGGGQVVAARGIAVIEACVDVRIFDCGVSGVTAGAIYVSAAETASVRTVVSGCRISGLTGGAMATNYPLYFGTLVSQYTGQPTCYHQDCQVIGNYVEGNLGMPANKPSNPNAGGTSDNIGIYQCVGAIVAHNHTYYGGDLGVSVQDCDRSVVIGNVCGVNDTDGIAVYSSTNSAVVGNLSFDNGRDWDDYYRTITWPRLDFSGIIQDSQNVLIAANRCWEDGLYSTQVYPQYTVAPGPQQYGVFVRGSAVGPMVADNQLEGNAKGPLDVPPGQLFNVPTQPGSQPVVYGHTTDPVVISLLSALQTLGLISVAGGTAGAGHGSAS